MGADGVEEVLQQFRGGLAVEQGLPGAEREQRVAGEHERGLGVFCVPGQFVRAGAFSELAGETGVGEVLGAGREQERGECFGGAGALGGVLQAAEVVLELLLREVLGLLDEALGAAAVEALGLGLLDHFLELRGAQRREERAEGVFAAAEAA